MIPMSLFTVGVRSQQHEQGYMPGSSTDGAAAGKNPGRRVLARQSSNASSVCSAHAGEEAINEASSVGGFFALQSGAPAHASCTQ